MLLSVAPQAPTLRSLVYRDGAHADVGCHLVVPPTLGPTTRMVVVLHGTERNPLDHREAWTDWACAHDRLVVCPHFDPHGWPGEAQYTLGGVLGEDGHRRCPSGWSFNAVTGIAALVRAAFGISDPRFDLWGHSAGAQFVHRYLLFATDAPVRRAIAANADWYTLPDLDEPYPYGAEHPGLGLTAAHLRAWAAGPLVLMRGSLDVERDATLRITEQADRQGPNRFERAARVFAAGSAIPGCRWQLIDVPGAAHRFNDMAAAAQRLLLGRCDEENPLTEHARHSRYASQA